MNASSNIPLKVPFKEKDEAKSLGARWNPEGKHWYIPEGVETTPFEKWLTDAPLHTSASTQKTSPSAGQTTRPKPVSPSENTLSKDADLDDINAMLRDAYEDNETM